MKTIKIPLRIVFYYEHDRWIAHCLEFDILGDGQTQEEALECLQEALSLQISASLEHNNSANLFTPAEGMYFRMFAEGQHVTTGALKIQVEGVEIEDIIARQYDPDSEYAARSCPIEP